MKNLVLLHLESLNKLNYRMNEENFAFLHSFERKCESYSHYYSTATSTIMVLSDLQYGSMGLFEACKSLDDVPNEKKTIKSLFDELSEKNFLTRVLVYPSSGDMAGAEKRHFLGQTIKAEEIGSYDAYISEIDKTLEKKKFAIHVVPTISNIALNRRVDISFDEGLTFFDEGYNVLNRITEHVIRKLEELNKLDDTVIVIYGDHGDDYWGHGMHGGLTHAIEPNNLLISAPLFIWKGKETKAEEKKNLIQTSDLRDIVLKALNNEEITTNRQYVFARNEYAGQEVRKDTFNKGYSVSDGRYMLLVTSNGLEMYDTVMDPSCLTNLLMFFIFERGILTFDIERNMKLGFHVAFFWGARQQRLVREAFYKLYENLIYELNLTYHEVGIERIEKELLIHIINRCSDG